MQRDTNDNKLRFICHGIAVCILLVGNDVHPNKMLILTTIRNVKTKCPPTPKHTHVIDSIADVYTIMYFSIKKNRI